MSSMATERPDRQRSMEADRQEFTLPGTHTKAFFALSFGELEELPGRTLHSRGGGQITSTSNTVRTLCSSRLGWEC